MQRIKHLYNKINYLFQHSKRLTQSLKQCQGISGLQFTVHRPNAVDKKLKKLNNICVHFQHLQYNQNMSTFII